LTRKGAGLTGNLGRTEENGLKEKGNSNWQRKLRPASKPKGPKEAHQSQLKKRGDVRIEAKVAGSGRAFGEKKGN